MYYVFLHLRNQILFFHCIFQTQLGDKYIILKPDSGLFYPTANYFCNKMMKIILKHDENNILFIIDCERIRSIDYTAIKVRDMYTYINTYKI